MLAQARSHSSAGSLASSSPVRGGAGRLASSSCGGSWSLPGGTLGNTTSRHQQASGLAPAIKPARDYGVQPEASSAAATTDSPTQEALIQRPDEAPGGGPSPDSGLTPTPPTSASGPNQVRNTSSPAMGASKSNGPASHGSSGPGTPAADVSPGMQSPWPAQPSAAADAEVMMPTDGASNTSHDSHAGMQLSALADSTDMRSVVADSKVGSNGSGSVTPSPNGAGSMAASAPPALGAFGSAAMLSMDMPASPQPALGAAGMDDATIMQLLGISISTTPSPQPPLTAAESPAPQHTSPHMDGPPGLIMLSHSTPNLATNGPLSADTMAALLALQQGQQQTSIAMDGTQQVPTPADLLRSPLAAAMDAQKQLLHGSSSLSDSISTSPINPPPQLMYDPVTGRLVGGEALVARALLASPAGSMARMGSGMYGSLPGSMEALCGSMGFQQGLAAGAGMIGACGSPAPGNRQNSLYKTELCRSWNETGACRYGNKCQFAHGYEELRPVIRHPKYKTEVCRTFAQSGTCPYGARCRFIHTARSAAASPAGAVVPMGSPALCADLQLAYAAGMVKSLSENGFTLPQGCMTPDRQVGAPFVQTPSPVRYGSPLMDAAAMRAGIATQSITANSSMATHLFGGEAAGVVPLGSATPHQQAVSRRLPVFCQLTDDSNSTGGSSNSSRQPASSGSRADEACWAAIWQGTELTGNACSPGGRDTPPPAFNVSMAAPAAAVAASPGPAQMNGWLASPQQHIALGIAQPGAAAASVQAQEAANDAVNAILSVLNI